MENTTLHLDLLSEINFMKNDVINEPDARKIRRSHLQKAGVLGNVYKRKVKIKFKTFEGKFNDVVATVWAVGEDFVSFRGGKHLPIKSIVEVEF